MLDRRCGGFDGAAAANLLPTLAAISLFVIVAGLGIAES
jgi:hypothetical protein